MAAVWEPWSQTFRQCETSGVEERYTGVFLCSNHLRCTDQPSLRAESDFIKLVALERHLGDLALRQRNLGDLALRQRNLDNEIRSAVRRIAAYESRVIPKATRVAIIRRDNEICTYCGGRGGSKSGPDGTAWHLDHVHARSRGGLTVESNLVLACKPCNERKRDLSLDEFLSLTSRGAS